MPKMDGIELAPTERVDTFQAIQRNGKYLLDIVNDILDLSKIESGRMEVEEIECSPHEIILDVASLMRVMADKKGLALEVEYNGPIPNRIHSDPTRQRQILINLVGNAIKFTDDGTVRVVASLLRADSDSPELQFDVTDTGIGMSPTERAKCIDAGCDGYLSKPVDRAKLISIVNQFASLPT